MGKKSSVIVTVFCERELYLMAACAPACAKSGHIDDVPPTQTGAEGVGETEVVTQPPSLSVRESLGT